MIEEDPLITKATNKLIIKSTHYFLASIAIVAALAYNDAMKETIAVYFPKHDTQEIWVKFVYALVITIVLVFLLICLPETKSELPQDVQTKLNDIAIENNNKKIKELEAKLAAFDKPPPPPS